MNNTTTQKQFDNEMKKSLRDEIMIALAGPFMSLLLATAMLLVYIATDKKYMDTLNCAYINFALALFNLLPIAELDGSRALNYFLCYFFEEKRVEAIINTVSVITVIPFGFICFYAILCGQINISAIIVCIYLIFLVIQKTCH